MTSYRHNVYMSKATLYLDDALHQALRMKAAETNVSMSELVNDALKVSLSDDIDDIRDIKARRKEKTVGYEAFLSQLEKDGVL